MGLTREQALKKYATQQWNSGSKTILKKEALLINRLYKFHLDKIFNDHEAQLKAKNEEIKKLRTVLVETQSDIVLAWSELGKSTARSIVAMLFWEWRRKQRLYLNHKSRSDKIGWGLYEQANIANTLFANAHAILKETK